MRSPAYITLSRHNVYYFRYPLPKAIQSAGVAREIKISLHTRDSRRALQTSRLLAYVGDIMANKAIQGGMTYAEIRAILREHFTAFLNNQRNQIESTGQLSCQSVHALRNSMDLGLRGMGTSDDENAIANKFIAQHQLPIKEGTAQYDTFKAEFDKAFRAYCAKAVELNAEFDTYSFETIEVQPVETGTSAQTGISVGALIDRYVQERNTGKNWTAKTEREYRAMFAFLAEILVQDRDCRTLTVADGRKVKEALTQRKRTNTRRGFTPRRAKKPDAVSTSADTLHVKTVNKHIMAYSGLFRWAKMNGYLPTNIFEGLAIKYKKKEARTAFSKDQISRMVQELHDNTGGLVRKDSQKWGTLLGIFTGARLNEIAQLTPGDVRQIDGIWCLDINEHDAGKHLKTEAARRIVPVHPRLIGFGFLEFVQAVREAGHDKLFHELTYDKNNGYGRNLGRWFNETFLVRLGMKDKQLVFHSLRHTMVTELLQAGVSDGITKAIVGHAQTGVTMEVYFTDGYKPEQLVQAIRLVHR
ncbi:site-specific integrase [Desulfovibrio aminophilus]|nr:site-specific integrase [Desulfovibrio aminophilus]MCM0755173.1 site-specific integrase [Desulfovibrio aminophilus]